MNFKAKKLSIAISGIVGSLAATEAMSQELEEITVTAIRGSLRQSMDVKRYSSGVVDAISAEDIGKFPDTNLAESMQRITGVSINRVNGEGSEVTVRGFGGGFNLVTLNGRQMPAANVTTITGDSNDIGANGSSRSFDFSNLASEGVAGIQVYKTGRAAVPTGGVGATININTIKPLESGRVATIGARALNDQGGDGVTGEFSGMYSWANEDNTLGFSVFGSLQDRDSSSRGINVSGYNFFNYTGTENHFTYRDPETQESRSANINNAPEIGQLYALPLNVGMDYSQIQRQRINGMATLQFAPNEDLLITADALYVSNELDGQTITPGIWFSRSFHQVTFDNSSVVAYPNQLAEFISNDVGKDLFFANYINATRDELESYGVNFEWQAREDLLLTFDASTSESWSGGNGHDGKNSWRFNVAGANAGWQLWENPAGGVPRVTISIQDGAGGDNSTANNNGVFDLPDVGTQATLSTDSRQRAEISQFNFSGNWEFNENINVDFGVGFLDTEMNQNNLGTLDFLGGWGVGSPGDVPAGVIQQSNVAAQFGDTPIGPATGAAELLEQLIPGESNTLTNIGEVAWGGDVIAFLNAIDGYGGTYDFSNPSLNGRADNIIQEQMTSAFFQATLDGEIGDMPTQTLVGIRYEQTEVTSITMQTVPSNIIWLSDNDFRYDLSSDLQSVSESHKYNNLLPSLDFSIDLSDELKARASFSRTLARPAYNNLYITTSYGSPNTPTFLDGVATGSKGNVKLDPLESDNYDLSIEWYYAPESYVSAGYYQKAVSNFVGTAQVAQPLFGITDPTSGRPGTISGDAVAALQAGGFPITEPNLFTMAAILANPSAFPNGAADFTGDSSQEFDILTAYDIPATANDPALIYEVSQPINNQTANIDGFEFAVQHFFGDTGFGLQANATIVNGDVSFDNAGDPSIDQFALEGLSDSANLVGIYEQDRFSARLAFNWRDAFLATTNRGNRMPAYVDAFQQLDFNVSYTVNDNLVLSLDGINITEEGVRIYGRTENILWFQGELDARYLLSARYSF